MLPSRPPHLCYDSVMSFDKSATPRPTKDLDNDLEAVLHGYELEEVNMEALWWSSSEEWTPEQNDGQNPKTSGEVVASMEWTLKECSKSEAQTSENCTYMRKSTYGCKRR